MTTMTKRMAPFCGTVALLAQVFVFQGCGGSNNGTGGTGGTLPRHRRRDDCHGRRPGHRRHARHGRHDRLHRRHSRTAGHGWRRQRLRSAGLRQHGRGMAIDKGVTCTATDTALCYKTCGPEKTGVKSETCPAGGGPTPR